MTISYFILCGVGILTFLLICIAVVGAYERKAEKEVYPTPLQPAKNVNEAPKHDSIELLKPESHQ